MPWGLDWSYVNSEMESGLNDYIGDPYQATTTSVPNDLPILTPEAWRASKVSEIRRIGRMRPVVGRRERALVWLVDPVLQSRDAAALLHDLRESGFPALSDMTFGVLMDLCQQDGDLHDLLSAIDLRINLAGIDPGRFMVTERGRILYGSVTAKDPELHYGLQDLGWMIGHELAQACNAFSDPDLWYPGVDEGIEPVSDAHVEMVIAATQRELERERRRQKVEAPLNDLPPRIQRAFAERRRYLYGVYGIGKADWQRNKWSLWSVQDDPAWLPPWLS